MWWVYILQQLPPIIGPNKDNRILELCMWADIRAMVGKGAQFCAWMIVIQ